MNIEGLAEQAETEATQEAVQSKTQKDVGLLVAIPGDQIWDVPNGGI